jgi:hypothetical protein
MRKQILLPAMGAIIASLILSTSAFSAPRRGEVPLENWEVPGQALRMKAPDVQFIDHQPISVEVQGFEFGTVTANALPSADGNFIAVTPCRVADTRNPVGPYGGPAISAGTTREFDIDGSACSIPVGAIAYSLNLTVVSPSAGGWIQVGAGGEPVPFVSTLNFAAGQTVANASIFPAGPGGTIAVKAAVADVHLIIDINGYFPEQKGHVIDKMVANLDEAPNGVSGYINVLSNYVPPVNATAFITARCNYDGSAAGQRVALRVAGRAPTGTGTHFTGNSYYQYSATPGPNLSVQNVVADFFDLAAGQSYDFGVYAFVVTPSGGTGPDWCSLTVMVTRR